MNASRRPERARPAKANPGPRSVAAAAGLPEAKPVPLRPMRQIARPIAVPAFRDTETASRLDTAPAFSDDANVNVERLNGLSIDALYALAEKMGLDLPPALERVFVVEAILEAFEEDNEDRKTSGDAAIHIEEKKYSGSELDEIDASLDAAPCIDRRYNETVIHCIARDPEWAFVFWDVRDEESIRSALYRRLFRFFPAGHQEARATTAKEARRSRSWSATTTITGISTCREQDPSTVSTFAYATARTSSRSPTRTPYGRRARCSPTRSTISIPTPPRWRPVGLDHLEIRASPDRHPSRILGGFDE